jgi:hypothetical protein
MIVTMNERYIAWDDAHYNSLTLYDRAAGHVVDTFGAGCTRPALAETRPYLVCLDYLRAYWLVRLPSGSNMTFSVGRGMANQIAVSGERAYWVAGQQGNPFSNQIAWLEMPVH